MILIAVAALLLILAMSGFAFDTYVVHIQHDAFALARETAREIRSVGTPDRRDAIRISERFAAMSFRSDLLIVLIDETHRVSIFHERSGNGAFSTRMLARGKFDRSGEPQAGDVLARVLLGLGTAFGLQTARAHALNLEIDVSANPVVFSENIEEYLPMIGAGLFALFLASLLSSRLLALRSRRQLTEITAALEHLAVGDFTPQFVMTRQGRLRTLASAYNRAAEQVQHAFAERDRAHVSMQRFIADAAHQLRTPLTVIRGYIGILRQGETPDTTTILNTMHQQCLLIGALIERLILLEQWEKERREPVATVELGELVRQILAPIADSHPRRTIRIEAETPMNAALDPDDFAHAVTNIVDNALKYTNGTVTVAVRADAASAQVEIRDEGPGMKPEQAERAFDRFFRGDRRDVEGSGLGLAIAKRAVERADGLISLVSNPKSGSRVTITLKKA